MSLPRLGYKRMQLLSHHLLSLREVSTLGAALWRGPCIKNIRFPANSQGRPEILSPTSYLWEFRNGSSPVRLWEDCSSGWLFFNWFERERQRERERDWPAVPPIQASSGWPLHMPWPGIHPATLVHQGNVPINWATRPGLAGFLISVCKRSWGRSPAKLLHNSWLTETMG